MATQQKTMPAVGPGCSPVSRLVSCLCGGHRNTAEEADSLQLNQETRPALHLISTPTLALRIQPKSNRIPIESPSFSCLVHPLRLEYSSIPDIPVTGHLNECDSLPAGSDEEQR